MKPQQLTIRTRSRSELVEITGSVADVVRNSGVQDGTCTVFVSHTTAGVTINENADPSVVHDILNHLEKVVPRAGGYTHSEGNSDSHIKASMMGHSVSVPVAGSGLLLGTWQGIYLCEFDGPRTRSCTVTVTA